MTLWFLFAINTAETSTRFPMQIRILTDTLPTRLAFIHDDVGMQKMQPQNLTAIYIQDAGFGVKA
jgi:hypothetical protein